MFELGFKLGSVEVRPAENALRIGDATVHIEPKSMQVLLALAEAGTGVLSREDLVKTVWPRGFVTDDALNRCISNLRRALRDDAKSPRFIVTVPRTGYRLAQAVRRSDTRLQGGLLVLPFQDLTGSEEGQMADAMTELLIARLSVALNERVISRTTAMTFRHAGKDLDSICRQLGVRWVVEGSVLQLVEQVQIVVQLIDGPSDAHVWAETWTRSTGDLLTILNEISRLVANQVRTELQDTVPPSPPRASLPPDLLREFLHGIQLNGKRTHECLRQAIVCFQRVLAERPDHAPALSYMAMSHFLLAHYGALPAAEGFEACRNLAQRALDLDARAADALVTLAAVRFHFDWQYREAESLIRQALEINANLEIAWLLLANISQTRGRPEAAQHYMDRALEIDPLNTGLMMNAGDHFILQRRFGEAIRVLQAAIDIEERFRPAWLRLSLAFALQRRPNRARSCLERVRQLQGEDAAYFEYLAIALGYSNQPGKAARAARQLEGLAKGGSEVLPWSLARAWAAAGQAESAINFLEAAFEMRSSSMPFLGVTPLFDSIRHLERVQKLMRRAGVAEWLEDSTPARL